MSGDNPEQNTGGRSEGLQPAEREPDAGAPNDGSSVTLQDDTGVFFSLLDRLGCSLALSTDDSRVIFIGVKDGKPTLKAVVLMGLRGLAVQGEWLAAGVGNGVSLFKNMTSLASIIPDAPNTYDAIFTQRAIHFTGRCDFHDMAFLGGAIAAVNTKYCCICTVDGTHSFNPIWAPPFITQLLPQDRCHLNGMAIVGGQPRYVSMLGRSDEPAGWRSHFLDEGGCLMEVPSGKVVAEGLLLPHSPRVIGGHLYCLESGRGNIVVVDPATGEKTTVYDRLPGFAHGLHEHRGILFVAVSKLRSRKMQRIMPIEEKGEELICGILAFEAATHKLLATLKVSAGIHEIYDLQLMPGVRKAEIRTAAESFEHYAIDLPKQTFWATEPRRDNNIATSESGEPVEVTRLPSAAQNSGAQVKNDR